MPSVNEMQTSSHLSRINYSGKGEKQIEKTMPSVKEMRICVIQWQGRRMEQKKQKEEIRR